MRYKDIPGYETHYQISSTGELVSKSREVIRKSHTMSIKSQKIKVFLDNSGYLSCNLYKEGRGRHFRIHQLVAMAFLNHKPNNFETVVDHIDGNKLNNNLENLRILQNWENISKSVNKNYIQKHKGITYHSRDKKWTYKYNNMYVAMFKTEEEAIKFKKQYEL